jgi:D-threonate/D-erythronate kinase
MASDRWFILADDLTGAADCAVAFARRGIAADVGWKDVVHRHESQVFSYNANSRDLTAAEAAARHREVLGRWLHRDRHFFRKIDSTLRGQPAAEIAVAVEVMQARSSASLGIFAPAFPAASRTTESGHVYVGGRPLEETETWRRDHTYPTAELVEVLSSAGIHGVKLPLGTVRDPEALRSTLGAIAGRKNTVAVCDASTQEDLDRIVAARSPEPVVTFFIGSGGLAHALAAATPEARHQPIATPRTTKGSLIVVGSLAQVSRAAARSLAATEGVRHVRVDPGILLSAADTGRMLIATKIIEGLEAGDDVLVEIANDAEPDLSIGARLAEQLAATLKPAARHLSGLAATGGETAAALLEHFGVNGMRLVDEIEPGSSLGLTAGEVRVPIVTKSGAFGDAGSLTRIAHRLRLIRQAGRLA